MAVDILMPELGESVHEGTVSRWLKNIGDFVKEDEPVVEIMTDKVNTELPAPASGILVKITIPEGELVEVFSAMGVIEPDQEKAKAMLNGSGGTETAESNSASPQEAGSAGQAPYDDAPGGQPAAAGQGDKSPAAEGETEPSSVPSPSGDTGDSSSEQSGDGRKWFTPVVKAMAKESGVSTDELTAIKGSGQGGRVTKKDLEGYLSNRSDKPAAAAQQPTAEFKQSAQQPAAKSSTPVQAGEDQEVQKLVGMRKMIADAMERSSQVPVVSTLIDVDVTELVRYRALNKDSFQTTHGVKLTYTPFFIKSLAECLLQFPMLNASLQDGQIVINKKVHMGCAVSLGKDGEGGLIVPVIHNCSDMSLPEIAKALNDIALRARDNKLTTEDVKGGTFTVTNPGSYGAVLGTPMISSPQSGIAGIYGIKEQPVIIDGMIAIRSMMNVVLTYDHRLVDGLMAGRFLQAFKQKIEKMDYFK